jgi:hypothetical protein
LTGIYFWGSKTVKKRIPEDFFFSCVSEGIFHWNVVWRGSQEFLFFTAFTGIFCMNSYGTGIPAFTTDSSGFFRIPPDSSGFLFPPNAVRL